MEEKKKVLTPELFQEMYKAKKEEEILDLSEYVCEKAYTLEEIIGYEFEIKNVKFPKEIFFAVGKRGIWYNFVGCEFSIGSLNTVKISKCSFDSCTFKNSVCITGLIEYNNFVNCIFYDLSIIEAIVIRCIFIRCKIHKGYIKDVSFIDTAVCDNEYGSDFEVYWHTVMGINDVCPSDGSFIGWKVCIDASTEKSSFVLVKLEIPEDAKRSSGFGRKCRASKAKVLGFYDIDGNHLSDSLYVHSWYDKDFVYRVGEVVKPTEPFDENWYESCSSGIHFFVRRCEAASYVKDGFFIQYV